MLVKIVLLAIFLHLSACGSSSDSAEQLATVTDQSQFLLDNAMRDGVSVTASGLQYEVLRAAEGSMPDQDSVVTVHYLGTLIDGTEFDSSYARGQPSSFPLGGTIPGWVEGVQLMDVGSQFRFVIPANLAYGDRGTGNLIKPGATLIFEVELLEINSG